MSPKNPHLTQMSHARPPPNYSNHREKNIKLSLLFMQKKICKMVEWFSFKILCICAIGRNGIELRTYFMSKIGDLSI